MKFNLSSPRNCQILLSHLLLEDLDTCLLVKDTDLWKTSETIEVKVSFNDIEGNPETLEKILHKWNEYNIKQASDKYDPENFNNRVEEEVQRRIEKLLEGKAGETINVLNELYEKLEDANNLVRVGWE